MRALRLAAGAVGAVLALAAVASAAAHAEPVRATPGDGAVVTSPPPEIVLTMSQDLARQAGANDIEVLDAAGSDVTPGTAAIDPADRRRLSVALPADLAPGEYVVRWKTLSAEDGDPASGELRFRYDPAGTPNPGREVLKESVLGGATPAAAAPAPSAVGGGSDGDTSWVLVAAVAGAALVIGAGGMYLLTGKGE
ncbi:copper resistance protein CopC [Tepidiforma sp.]|uniref:copper resistance CopC family protein n=1 Tax=Tepidiforma sp. TaxID=2682230 RepID=UPI002ADE07D9|nr:copper resistance protein CopC [Tepidiforma sp.]